MLFSLDSVCDTLGAGETLLKIFSLGLCCDSCGEARLSTKVNVYCVQEARELLL